MTARRKTLLTVSILLVIVAVAVAVGVWRVLGSAPEEVSLAGAVEVAQQAQAGEPTPDAETATTEVAPSEASSGDDASGDTPATGSDPAAPASDDAQNNDRGSSLETPTVAADGVDGSWEVDAETGTFTLEDATGSFVGFRVNEELARIGEFTAVGRTGAVSGTMEIAGERVTATEIAVDLTTLKTDDSHRDGAVQRALRTSQHPTATFTLTEELPIEGAAADGVAIATSASGDLTVNGMTQPVVVDISAQLVGELIAVVGSIEITFADFDVTIPRVPIVLSAEDHGIMEFQLLFRRR